MAFNPLSTAEIDVPLPVYVRCGTAAVPSEDQGVEIRMRWGNLHQTIEHEAPDEIAVMDEMDFDDWYAGKLSFQNATILAELCRRVDPDDRWTNDEIGLLLNAGGYHYSDGELYQVPDMDKMPELLAQHRRAAIKSCR